MNYKYDYDYPLYRPPSEGRSLILQITLGCSHNKCSFCNMYKEKNFKIKSLEEIKEEIDFFRNEFNYVKRIFLADGDALIIKTSKLIEILKYINEKFPESERISMYASPKSLEIKTREELLIIKENGVKMIYLGLESGDDRILKERNKGASSNQIISGGLKAKSVGIKLSVTVIAGLAGVNGSKEHAIKTGKAISRLKPYYLGILSLVLLPDTKILKESEEGKFKQSSGNEMLEEILMMIENINVKANEKIIMRSNHISNYLNLSGTLPKDKEKLILEIKSILETKTKIERMERRTL